MSEKKTLTFKISIPKWLYRCRFSNIKKYVKWLVHPFYCKECGKKVVFRNPKVDWYDGNVRKMMLDFHLTKRNWKGHDTICTSCLASHVEYKNMIPKHDRKTFSRDETRRKCDCCGEKVKSFKWVGVKTPVGNVEFILGKEWWNGFYICPTCIKQTLLLGKQTTSVYTGFVSADGKYYSVPQNEYGLPVIDGKVKFPFY